MSADSHPIPARGETTPTFMTFAELVAFGREHAESRGTNGMPWSFKLNGVPVTHENDECYLVLTRAGMQRFTPRDRIQIGPIGQVVVLYGAPAASLPVEPAETWTAPQCGDCGITLTVRAQVQVGFCPYCAVHRLAALTSEVSALREAVDRAQSALQRLASQTRLADWQVKGELEIPKRMAFAQAESDALRAALRAARRDGAP